MECIYIDNYMILSPQEREAFLYYVHVKNKLNILTNELISSEHSLLLSCKKEKDNKLVYKNIDYFFKDINSINVYMVEKSLTSIGETTLLFVESNKEIRI